MNNYWRLFLIFISIFWGFFHREGFTQTKSDWVTTPSFSDTPEKVLSPTVNYSYGYGLGLVDGLTYDSFFNFFIGPHKTTGDQHVFPLIRVGYLTSLFVPTIQVGLGYHYDIFTITSQYVLGLPFLRDDSSTWMKSIKTKEEFKERILNYYWGNFDLQFRNLKLKGNIWVGNIYQTSYIRGKSDANGDPKIEVKVQPLLRSNLIFDILYYSDIYNDLYFSGGLGISYNWRWHNLSWSEVGMLKFNLLMTGWGELLINTRLQYLYNSAPKQVYDRLSLFSIENKTNPDPMVRTIDFSDYTGNMEFSVPITYRIKPFFWLNKWQYSPFKSIYFATTFYMGVIWKDAAKSSSNTRFGYAFLESIGYDAYKMDLNISFGVGYSPQRGGTGIVLNFLSEL